MAEETEATVAAENVQIFSAGARTEEAGPLTAVPGLGNVTAFFVRVGPSSTPGFRLTIVGLQLTTAFPRTALFTPRQGPDQNQEFGFPDEFGVQVIRTSTNSVLVRVLRLDMNSGWGQNLHLSGLIVD